MKTDKGNIVIEHSNKLVGRYSKCSMYDCVAMETDAQTMGWKSI